MHHNGDLADADKLKYLRGFLEGPAKSVISGIPMTDTSYETAVNLLKGRYANPTVIQRAFEFGASFQREKCAQIAVILRSDRDSFPRIGGSWCG